MQPELFEAELDGDLPVRNLDLADLCRRRQRNGQGQQPGPAQGRRRFEAVHHGHYKDIMVEQQMLL